VWQSGSIEIVKLVQYIELTIRKSRVLIAILLITIKGIILEVIITSKATRIIKPIIITILVVVVFIIINVIFITDCL
jgi:hypothetical protein